MAFHIFLEKLPSLYLSAFWQQLQLLFILPGGKVKNRQRLNPFISSLVQGRHIVFIHDFNRPDDAAPTELVLFGWRGLQRCRADGAWLAADGRNRVAVETGWWRVPRVARQLATPGFGPEFRWNSPRVDGRLWPMRRKRVEVATGSAGHSFGFSVPGHFSLWLLFRWVQVFTPCNQLW